ncbi:hypothetical protein ACTG4Q_20915 [Bradyrhizobium denitrificans]
MKLRALAALAVTLALTYFTPAAAAQFDLERGKSLDNNTTGFVVVATASSMLILACDYEAVEGSLAKGADIMGVDIDIYGPAVANALKAVAGMEYDREKMIPDVTKTVRWTLEGFWKEYNVNKRKACASWAEGPASNGFVRKAGTNAR